jgi:monooxygenase
MSIEHFDVLIVGAGLSGIGAGVYLQKNCPGKTYAILEARDRMGGTWDLFKYPGIRTDSDMYTLGYGFKPWTGKKVMADGADILGYIRETAQEHNIESKVRYRHTVKRLSWSSTDAKWTVEVERGDGQPARFTCNFLYCCAGYYRYDAGYLPDFPGIDRFKGQLVHPQKWPEGLDYSGKRVVVIGSGATAVTLIPSMTDNAAHVTMLQRSPTYIISRPVHDGVALALRRFLPEMVAYKIARWKNVLLTQLFYIVSRRAPNFIRKLLLAGVRQGLGPSYDVNTHFNPRYNPWDQRVCAVPGGDLFKAIRKGKASVVTDHIETFTDKGIKLKSGQELEADIIITATGLRMQLFGGMEATVDGRAVDPSQHMIYKGMMVNDVPNMAMATGYTNASWSLKCGLVSEYVCRLINHMDKHGYRQCTPRRNDPTVQEEPLLDLSSGYVQRAAGDLPKGGSKAPWKMYQNYALDIFTMHFGALDDGAMEFSSPGVPDNVGEISKAA